MDQHYTILFDDFKLRIHVGFKISQFDLNQIVG